MFGLQDSDDEDVEGEIDDQIEVRFVFKIEKRHLIFYFKYVELKNPTGS